MKNLTDFEDILSKEYGPSGSATRDKYDEDSSSFRKRVMEKLKKGNALKKK